MLMILIQRVMTSARAQQKLTYYHLKGDERSSRPTDLQ
jgi:hypothetical protein